MDLSVTSVAVACVVAVMVPTWLLSLALRDASIADVAWGLVFVAIAWGAYAAGPGQEAMLVAAGAVSVWGLRLSAHIGIRNRGHGEDRRYTAMRDRRPGTFWLWSLFGVFLLQGAIALVVSLPLQSLASDAGADASLWTWVGLAVAIVGYGFEAIGDAQLSAFKGDPASKGKVMDRGLWRYTRHPNYFGDALFWWGIWLVAVGSGAALWTLIGPALMTFLLVRISGVRMLESDIAERRPEYAAYIRRTSAFIPRLPKAD
jgi:steroid 5-alpha reductase family enzyme